VELALRLLHLVLVASDEQGSDVVRVGELPGVLVLLLAAHILEVIDHLLTLSSLLEASRVQRSKLALVL